MCNWISPTCFTAIAVGIQAVAAVFLVIVTILYVQPTRKIAEEIKRNTKRQRQKGMVLEFLVQPYNPQTGAQLLTPPRQVAAILRNLSERNEQITDGDLKSLLYEMIMEKTVRCVGPDEYQAVM